MQVIRHDDHRDDGERMALFDAGDHVAEVIDAPHKQIRLPVSQIDREEVRSARRVRSPVTHVSFPCVPLGFASSAQPT